MAPTSSASNAGASPLATTDPHEEVRGLVSRYFFGTTACVAALAAVLFALLPGPLAWSQRVMLLVGYATLVAGSMAGRRAPPDHMRTALLAVSMMAIATIVLSSSVLQWGISSPSMGLLALITCVACGVAGARAGAVVGLSCVVAICALAAAEMRGVISGAAAQVHLSMTVRLGTLIGLLGVGYAGGVLLARVVARYIDASAEREQRFRGLLWIAADAYWEMDARFHLVSLLVQRSGTHEYAPVHRRLGRAPWELDWIEFDDDMLDAHRADLEAHRPFRDLPMRLRCEDGRLRHVLVSGEPRFDARGVLSGYWGVARDATEDMQARQALSVTQIRYRELFNRIPTPLLLHRQGRIIDANPSAIAMFGYPDLDTMLGQDMQRLYEPGESRELAARRMAELEALPPGAALEAAELRALSLEGQRMVVRCTGVRIESEDGPATLSTYEDDTHRHAAEEAVRRSQALLSHVIETSPDMITLTELQSGRFLMVNQAFVRMTGYSVEETIGRTATELGLWADPQDRERVVRGLRTQPMVQDSPSTLARRDGSRVPMLVSGARFVMDGRDYLVINGRDVTETERTRKEHEAILQNASIGIAFTRDRVFVQANVHCEQIFGWPRGGLIGQPGSAVWPNLEEYEAMGREIGPLLGAGQQVETERVMARRDGSQFLCRILAKAVDPAAPRTGGTIWILDDVTDRRLMDQALAKARDDAEAASRAKSAFLANTSHELRTPLNGLVGLTRLARQPDIDEPQRAHYLEQISDSAETLSAIINDILDLSKIEAGKLHIETLAFDLHALLMTLQRAYGTLAQARALGFSIDIAPDVPHHVLGDPVRVRQILSNYLSNALKFTAHGGVRLQVRHVAADIVRFEVQDTGPGIAPDVQERLFRPFTQADQSTTRRFGGTGLGLSICHELASLMDGAVGVHSAVGKGSCFWAELPLPPTDSHDVLSGFGQLDATGPMAGARVLMVEDNPVNMMIAVALLEQWGVRVTQASNGPQAIEAVDQAARAGHPFDAVLMDVQMPEMSGHEATRLLRERYDAVQLPVIALTAAALVSERDEALASGMNDFLTKPIDAQRLRSALLNLLDAKRRR